MSIQIAVCARDFDPLLHGRSAEALLRTSLNQQLSAAANAFPNLLRPNPSSVAACIAENQIISIWLMIGNDPPTAPQSALSEVHILPPEAGFACQITKQMLDQLAVLLWRPYTTKNHRLNDAGKPDAKGKIELQRAQPFFKNAGTALSLTIKGTYHSQVDVPFTLTSMAALKVERAAVGGPGWISCQTNETLELDLSAVDSINDAITAAEILLGPAAIVGGQEVRGKIQREVNNAVAAIRLPALPSLQELVPLFPWQINIPKTKPTEDPGIAFKLLFSYDNLKIDMSEGGSGILAWGAHPPTIVRRQPFVLITGPRSRVVLVPSGKFPPKTVALTYTAMPAVDLRPPLRFVWDAEGKVSTPAMISTEITFTLAQTLETSVSKKIRLEVTDDDGLRASRAADVTIDWQHVAVPKPPTHYDPRRILSD